MNMTMVAANGKGVQLGPTFAKLWDSTLREAFPDLPLYKDAGETTLKAARACYMMGFIDHGEPTKHCVIADVPPQPPEMEQFFRDLDASKSEAHKPG